VAGERERKREVIEPIHPTEQSLAEVLALSVALAAFGLINAGAVASCARFGPLA
jgi:hypothetical protein